MSAEATADSRPRRGAIKILVWDLDNTLWRGTLAEGDDVRLRPGVLEVLKTLDERGILHSIASRNDHDDAMARLGALGVVDYFLHPQIDWGAKSAALPRIAEALNLGLDAFGFIDDQPFERAEVRHVHPQVTVYAAEDLAGLLECQELTPRFITGESALRRGMYVAESARKTLEDSFAGPQEDFLSGLEMRMTIQPARPEDLRRAEELTVRTNQLNATGYTYSYEELDVFRSSAEHLLLVASLDDRFGTYGKIGLALIEQQDRVWTLKLLLMSCRVMSRGVGSVLLAYVQTLARDADASLEAEFVKTARNRQMYVTYKFGGFAEVDRRGDVIVFRHDPRKIQPFPDYVELELVPPPVPSSSRR